MPAGEGTFGMVATTAPIVVSMRTTLDVAKSDTHSDDPSTAIENGSASSAMVAMTVFVWGSTWTTACSSGLFTQTELASIARSGLACRSPRSSGGTDASGVAIGIVATTALVAGSMRERVPSISLYTQIAP